MEYEVSGLGGSNNENREAESPASVVWKQKESYYVKAVALLNQQGTLRIGIQRDGGTKHMPIPCELLSAPGTPRMRSCGARGIA